MTGHIVRLDHEAFAIDIIGIKNVMKQRILATLTFGK